MSTTTHDFKPTKVVASEQPETNFKMIAENVTITYGGVPAVENHHEVQGKISYLSDRSIRMWQDDVSALFNRMSIDKKRQGSGKFQ